MEKFYQKTWFIILALIVFAPVGVVLMWMYRKSWNTVVKAVTSVVMLVIFMAAVIGGGSDNAKTVATTTMKTVEETTTVETTVDISAMTNEEKLEHFAKNVDVAFISYEDSSVTVDVSAVNLLVETSWDEDHLVSQAAQYTVQLMEQVFENTDLASIKTIFSTNMIDSKGNESIEPILSFLITREEAADINYKNFNDMVLVDYNKLINICEEIYIAPGIRKNLEDLK